MQRSLPLVIPSCRSFASSSPSCAIYDFPRTPNPTLWQVLGVKENASIGEVKAAYYDRVRTLHPDAQSSTTPDGHPVSPKDRFHLLQTAYETLGNADKRSSYINSQRHRFPSSTASYKRPPIDPYYNPNSTRGWTTWEGRGDSRSSPYANSQRPPPRNPSSPYRDPFSAAWGQSRNSSPYGRYHTGGGASGATMLDGLTKDRLVTWCLCWMLFGILLSTNSASNYDTALKASHSSAVSSLRDAEDNARARGGEWRPAVESRLARFRAREEQVREEKFQQEVLAMMQQEFRSSQNSNKRLSESSSSSEPTLKEARIRSREMIEEELRDTRAAREARKEENRLRNLSYPPGFIGPKQQLPGMVKVSLRPSYRPGDDGKGRDARPLTAKERRKELVAAGVREPGNPARDLPEGSPLRPVDEEKRAKPMMSMGKRKVPEFGVEKEVVERMQHQV